MAPWKSWLNASGGLKYHFKALRYQNSFWQSHRQATALWLAQWNTVSDHLLLVGPSAGYALSADFLKRFKTVSALDPDPFARKLFDSRFPDIKVQWTRHDYFVQNKKLWPDGIFYLREEFPQAAILFCNLLGQLPLLVNDFEASLPAWKRRWTVFLQSGEWASFHDLWSTAALLPTSPSLSPPFFSTSASSDLRNSVNHFGRALPPNQVIHDHMTKDLFPERCERSQWIWQIDAKNAHCIEGVRPSKQFSGA